MDLHLIHKKQSEEEQGPLEIHDAENGIWKSGFWKIGKDSADQSIGASIYIHDKQALPSYLGGEITGFDFVRFGDGERVLFYFKRLASHEGVTQSEGWYREKSVRVSDGDAWSDEEIDASVDAYLQMMQADIHGEKVNKTEIYRQLESKFGRRSKAYERRMMNISHVVKSLGGEPVRGLVPQGNIGTNEAKIRRALQKQGVTEESSTISAPTTYETDPAILESKTQAILDDWTLQRKTVKPPNGLTTPMRRTTESKIYERSPEVKAWVLRESGFVCESCDKPAQFVKDDGTPYLEVHHVVTLAESGPDTVANAVAVCADCHRALHFASDRRERIERLYHRIERLRKP